VSDNHKDTNNYSVKQLIVNTLIHYFIKFKQFLIKIKSHLVEVFLKEPINGLQARVPFRWSWKEDWKISMFLMPFSQSDKSVKTPPNRTSKTINHCNNKTVLTNIFKTILNKGWFILGLK